MDLAENSVLSAFDRGLLLYGPMASPEFADHAPLANTAFVHMPLILSAILDGKPEEAEAATLSKLRIAGQFRPRAFCTKSEHHLGTYPPLNM